VEVRLIKDAELFAEVAAEYMSSDPFSTNVIGVQLAGVLGGSRPQGTDDVWPAVLDHDHVVGAAMHTPPFPVFVSRMPAAAAAQLAEALLDAVRTVPGVNGESTAGTAFADAWSARTGVYSWLQTSMRMYRLGELQDPTAFGTAAAASPEDAHLVRTWLGDFHAEATPDEPTDDLTAIAERRIAASELYLWRDGGRVVSLAGHSAPANGVARVGPVYTPPRERRRGYGAAVTAAASRAALDARATHVVLYTDLANRTSNAVYQSIGYLADHDAQERRFQGPIPNS